MTTITPTLEQKIKRRAKRAWRHQRDGAKHSVTRVTDVTPSELNYRLPYTPDYYGKEKVRVVKNPDGSIEVDPKTKGLIHCKVQADIEKLKKHGGEVRAYVRTKRDGKAGRTGLLSSSPLKKGDNYSFSSAVEFSIRSDCTNKLDLGERVFVVELQAADIVKLNKSSFTAKKVTVTDELDPIIDLGFTIGLLFCKTQADLSKIKKHDGEIRAFLVRRGEKPGLISLGHVTTKPGDRFVSWDEAVDNCRPGERVWDVRLDPKDITSVNAHKIEATACRLVGELSQTGVLKFTQGGMIDLVTNADLKKVVKHDGMVRGYKYVTKDLKSPTRTGPEQIAYKIGEDFEILDADIDSNRTCSNGINIASQEWCKSASNVPPNRLLAFEFHSKDIAAVPTDGGKLRVFRCKCVEEVDASFKPINLMVLHPQPRPVEKKKKKDVAVRKLGPKPKKKGFWNKLFGG